MGDRSVHQLILSFPAIVLVVIFPLLGPGGAEFQHSICQPV